MSVGLISTANLPTDLAKKSFSAMITRLMPNGTAPLFGLTALLKDETAYNIEHGYFTKTMIFPSATTNGAVADGTVTNIVVASNTDLVIGDLLRADSTGEVVLVTGIPDATHLIIQRGVGTIAAARLVTPLLCTTSVMHSKKVRCVPKQLQSWRFVIRTTPKSSAILGQLPRRWLQCR
jgi:hypothetical protein